MTNNDTFTVREMTLLRRLERLPLTRVQGLLLIQGGLGYTFDAMDGAVVAFILPPVASLFTALVAQVAA